MCVQLYLTPKLPYTGCVSLIWAYRVGREPLGGMHVVIVRLMQRLGVS